MSIRKRVLVAALAAATVPLAAGIALATTSAATPAAASSGGATFAYFEQWGIYGNAFYPKNLDTNGTAGKLDYLVYAFENIDPTNLTCFEATKASDSTNESNPNAGDGAGDAFADYQKSFGSDISVDGVADTWNQPIVGNFNQLKKLKAKYPKLKILVSIGGWTYSKYFSDVAATDASRKKLVSSCVDMFIKGNLPVQGGYGGAGTAAGIFDGIDVDWEYPGGGGHTGNHASANDKQNFTLLLAELRSQLDAYGAANGGKKMYLTAAMPAGQDKIKYVETDKIGQYLDYANVMTYDMHGAWDATGPTNHQSPIYESPSDPMNPVPPGTEKYTVDNAVKAWTTGSSAYGIPGGFPAAKLTVGVPLYYRGWTGVTAGSSHGLYSTASGPSSARPLTQQAGVAAYKELTGFVDNPSYTYWDPVTLSSYFYNGTEFFSGETKQSIKAKIDYAHCKGLGGAMVYALSNDPSAVLVNEIVTDVSGSAAACPTSSPTPTGSTGPSTSASPSKSPSSSPSTSPSTGTCSAAAWNAGTAYTGGAVVSYNGHTWKAQWWTQGETPGSAAVWADQGACGGGTTTTPTGNCPAAWSAGTAYSGGATASYNGHKWTAKWWTQGDIPGNNSQNVWTDNGAC
ncbi:glycosyl hydrolase family 18 protein [Dactylosporangium salmoneum]|uniref:chitinase n=1 Tax=Dactylosporangium salmoneum TaxID=53361 RepID=A0ABN3GW94_9ACTN